ncbi:MAG: hypothetical protein ABIH78_04780 [Candidatus Peregrinibacteria bacterium]
MLRAKLKREDGFIAIVALAMFMLMSLFGIILQQRMVDTVGSLKRWGNLDDAEGLAFSGGEYLLYTLKDFDAGYNTGEIVCNYGSFAEGSGGSNPTFCQDIDAMVSNEKYQGKNIQVKIEIKGRPATSEKFGDCSAAGFDGDCYVVPSPGTGTAGDRCDFYNPIFANEDSDSANTLIGNNSQPLENGGIEGQDGLAQIDYACNWNKLTFGSSITDRAAIPFYYQVDEDTIVSPFNSSAAERDGGAVPQAQKFALRVRTPCLPCVYDTADKVGGINRVCERGDDPTICYDYDQSPNERYELKVGGIDDDDVVVQWQLTGMCDEGGTDEECGLIQYVKYITSSLPERIDSNFSGITEGRINNYVPNLAHPGNDANHQLLYPTLLGIDTSTYEQLRIFKNLPGQFGDLKLPSIKQPFLTLFLSNKLISQTDKNVPYLEYQVLTDQPIGNQSTELHVTVNVDGNVFEKTIYQDQSKPLIDFAVQN